MKKGDRIKVMYEGTLRDAVYECKSSNKELCMVYLEPPTTLNGELMLDLVRIDEIVADK